MTAAVLVALSLLASPVMPVGYSWFIAPEPEPPVLAPPWWVPFRLDALTATVVSAQSEAVVAQVLYRVDGRPDVGWVGWRSPRRVQLAAGQPMSVTFEVPWAGYAPGCAMFVVWVDCGDGRVHAQAAAIPRPGEVLPPEFADMAFADLARGAFCPPLTPPTRIFADGFESGSLGAWTTM